MGWRSERCSAQRRRVASATFVLALAVGCFYKRRHVVGQHAYRATRLRLAATNPGILNRIIRHCELWPTIRIQNRFANGQIYVGVIGLASGCRAVTVSRGYQHVHRYHARPDIIKCMDSVACKLCMRRGEPSKFRILPISTGPTGRSVCENPHLHPAYIEFVQQFPRSS